MKIDTHIVKLVRDKIPEIVARERGSGKASSRVAGAREFSRLLRDKLREEVAEFLASGKPEELADILEVVRALAEEAGIRPRELEAIRRRKAKKRGGFGGRKVMRFKKVTRGYEKIRKDTRGYGKTRQR